MALRAAKVHEPASGASGFVSEPRPSGRARPSSEMEGVFNGAAIGEGILYSVSERARQEAVPSAKRISIRRAAPRTIGDGPVNATASEYVIMLL